MNPRECYHCRKPLRENEHYCTYCGSLLLLEHNDSIYRIQKTLGSGGFGRVYQADEYARNGKKRRSCAIKVIEERPNLSSDHIQREVQVLLEHASQFGFMPDIYHYWCKSQKHFIAMQFIAGDTLGEIDTLPWSPAGVLAFLKELLGHLKQLHQADIIHRDIKPHNIKRSPTRGYVLLDFGLASEGEKTILPGLSPDYAPIEQFYERRPAGFRTGYRTDLYSLAATAYHLLTGTRPTRADHRFFERKQLLPPSHNESIPDLLQHMLSWMLELKPELRAPNAQSLLDLISRADSIGPRPWPNDRHVLEGEEPTIEVGVGVELPHPTGTTNATILQSSRGRLYSVDWSPDGRYLAAGSALGVSIYELKSKAKSFYSQATPVQRVAFLRADTVATLTPQHIQLLRFPADLTEAGRWETRQKRNSQYGGDWRFYAAGSEKLVLIDHDTIRLLPITSTAQGTTIPELVAGTAAVSTNGRVLATANIEGISIWHLDERRLLPKKHIPIASDTIQALALTADGSRLAIGFTTDVDRGKLTTDLVTEVWLWDVIHSRAIPEPPLMPGKLIDLDITPDGTMLAVVLAVGSSHQIHLWSIPERQLLRIFEDTTGTTNKVAFAPNGTLLAGHSHEQITIWHVDSGEATHRFDDYMDSMTCIAYSSDGRWLAAMGGSVRVWHMADDEPHFLLKLQSHSSEQNGLAFSPDGNSLVTACGKEMRVWSLCSETPLEVSSPRDLVIPLISIPQGIDDGHSVIFTEDKIVCVMQGSLQHYSSLDGQIIKEQPIPDMGLDDMTTVMTLDGEIFVSYSGRTMVIWHDQDPSFEEVPVSDDISSVAISPDKRLIAVSTELSTSILRLGDLQGQRVSLEHGATRIVFDTTSTRLALLSHCDIDVYSLSGRTLNHIARFTNHSQEVRDAAFAPSGRHLASVSEDGTVRLWELAV